MSGPLSPEDWERAIAEGHEVRWLLVQDPDLGTIAAHVLDGQIVSTAAADGWTT